MHLHESEAAAALTRRRFLTGAGAVAVAGVVTAVSARRAFADAALGPVALGVQPRGLPARQHAWAQWLHDDGFGNPVAPRFDRLLARTYVGPHAQILGVRDGVRLTV